MALCFTTEVTCKNTFSLMLAYDIYCNYARNQPEQDIWLLVGDFKRKYAAYLFLVIAWVVLRYDNGEIVFYCVIPVIDRVGRLTGSVLGGVDKRLPFLERLPGFITGAQAALNLEQCTDGMKSFDRRTTMPSQMRQGLSMVGRGTSIGGSRP